MIIGLSHVYQINAINNYIDTTSFTIQQGFITALDSISKRPYTDYLQKERKVNVKNTISKKLTSVSSCFEEKQNTPMSGQLKFSR